MKIDFSNLNIEPMPNPKTLKVLRVSVRMGKSETAAPSAGSSPYGFVRNANVHPAAIIRRRS